MSAGNFRIIKYSNINNVLTSFFRFFIFYVTETLILFIIEAYVETFKICIIIFVTILEYFIELLKHSTIQLLYLYLYLY